MAQLFVSPFLPAFTNLGAVAPGATLTFYDTGTSTEADIWADEAMTEALANPVIADSAGRFPDIFLDPDLRYRVVLKTSADVVIDEVEGYTSGAGVLKQQLAASTGAALIGVSGGGSLQTSLTRMNALLFDAARWGVVADGSDMTGPLNAVIDACEAAGGGIIQLPRGIIGTTGMDRTALLGVPWVMRGHGMLATALRKVGTSDAPVFRLTGPDAAYDWYGGFQKMAFDGPFTGPTPNYGGLNLRRIARCITDRIRVTRCKDGVLLEGALILNFNDCSVNGNERGYVTRKSGSTPYSNLIMWRGGECRGNTGWGFDLGEGEALYIEGVDTSGNGAPATGFTGAIIIRETVDDEFGYARVYLKNLYIEANTSRSLFVQNAAGLYLKLSGVGVLGANPVPTFKPVEIGNIASVHIEDSLLLCETLIYAQQSDIADSLINDLDDTSTVRHVRNLRSFGPPVPLSLGNGAIRAGAGTLGVFGATPIAKPTVTGSRASGAATTSLLTQLAALGLITDSTTA